MRTQKEGNHQQAREQSRCATLACVLFRADSGRAFCFSLNASKNLNRGPTPGRDLLPEITLYAMKTYWP